MNAWDVHIHTHACTRMVLCRCGLRLQLSSKPVLIGIVIQAANLLALSPSSGHCLSSYTVRRVGGRLSTDCFPQRGRVLTSSFSVRHQLLSSLLCHLIRTEQAREDAVKSN